MPADTKATLEQSEAAENIARQQLTNNVEQRIQNAQALLRQGQPEAALNALRLTQNVVRSATDVPEADRAKLDRRIQAQLLATVQAEERVVSDRAERVRLDSAAEQRTRAVDLFQRDKQTIEAMMIQFDLLIREGVYNVLYNGGFGDIVTSTAPFSNTSSSKSLEGQHYVLLIVDPAVDEAWLLVRPLLAQAIGQLEEFLAVLGSAEDESGGVKDRRLQRPLVRNGS